MFELKGKSGKEHVEFYNISGDGRSIGSATLNTSWTKFAFSLVYSVEIKFVNDKGNTNDVFLRNPEKFQVDYEEIPGYWTCGADKTNERCIIVKESAGKGDFKWAGNYVIRYRGILCSHSLSYALLWGEFF